MKYLNILIAFQIALLGGCGGSDQAGPSEPAQANRPIMIGFSMGGIRMERWKKDEQIVIQRAGELGATVVPLSANENPDLQNEQAENLIIQGVDVLLVVPQNAEKSAKIVEMAHKAGIPVIAYDRIIRNCDLDYYVSFDNEKVGEFQAQGVVDALAPDRTNRLVYIGGSPVDNNSLLLKKGAMRVLDPLLKSGKATLELETFTPDWSAQKAYLDMKNYLACGGLVDGVIAANDATASGVIEALREQGLAGKIPVSGQDAELTACQRIAQGMQQVTVYKPLKSLGEKAVEMAVKIARGESVQANASINNGQRDVPSVLLESIPVTRDNLDDTVIRDGFHSREDVFAASRSTP